MTTTYEGPPPPPPLPPPKSPPSPSSAPRRTACDRCHEQKLRCPRDPNGGPCFRCLKANAVCHVSPARPTGRPPKHFRPQPPRSESLQNEPSRPSSIESTTPISESFPTPSQTTAPTFSQMPAFSTPNKYFGQPVSSLPLNHDLSNFYPTSDLQLGLGNALETTYANDLNFEYLEGNALIRLGMSLSSPEGVSFHQNTTLTTSSSASTGQLSLAPPPHLTPSQHIEKTNYFTPTTNPSRYEDFAKNENDLYDPFDPPHQHEITPQGPVRRFSYSPSLKRRYPASGDSGHGPDHPRRSSLDIAFASKKRQSSAISSSTSAYDAGWSPDLVQTNPLLAIQSEVDEFLKSLTHGIHEFDQQGQTGTGPPIDVGGLLRISNNLALLVPQICDPTSRSHQFRSQSRSSSRDQFDQARPKRSRTEPGVHKSNNSIVESTQQPHPNVIHQLLICYSRVLRGFSAMTDIIFSHISSPAETMTPLNLFASSIGSYIPSSSSPLSLILHLHAMSYTLQNLDFTMHKSFSTRPISSTNSLQDAQNDQRDNQPYVQLAELTKRKWSTTVKMKETISQLERRGI